MTYNVYTHDGSHVDLVDKFDTIFEALGCFYESIIDGYENYFEGIELATETDDEIESIEYVEL